MADLLALVGEVLDTINDALNDNAERFTCGEAEALFDLYTVMGRSDAGDRFMESHAAGDDEGDDHLTIDELSGWRRR